MGHLIANQTFVAASPKPKKKGEKQQPPRVVKAGTVVDEKDVIVKGREALFDTIEQNAARHAEVVHHAKPADETIEQATAAPGEKRTRRT